MVVHLMVHPYWVGHSGVTSAHFVPTACFGLWLLASIQVDCVNLTAVLIPEKRRGLQKIRSDFS